MPGSREGLEDGQASCGQPAPCPSRKPCAAPSGPQSQACEAPWRNASCTSSSEERLLKTLLRYAEYYNESRTHQSLDGNAPKPRSVERKGEIIATPVLGGLHHRYSRAA